MATSYRLIQGCQNCETDPLLESAGQVSHDQAMQESESSPRPHVQPAVQVASRRCLLGTNEVRAQERAISWHPGNTKNRSRSRHRKVGRRDKSDRLLIRKKEKAESDAYDIAMDCRQDLQVLP